MPGGIQKHFPQFSSRRILLRARDWQNGCQLWHIVQFHITYRLFFSENSFVLARYYAGNKFWGHGVKFGVYQWGGGGGYFSLFVTRLHSCLSVCLFGVHFNATIIIQNPVFPVKLVSSLCVFMFRPAIRTF